MIKIEKAPAVCRCFFVYLTSASKPTFNLWQGFAATQPHLLPPALLIFAGVKSNERYELVIGLEVHAQLMTRSKLFCGDPTNFGAEPNTQVSPVSLAHPGTLPVMNKEVIDLAVTLGLALHCNINRYNYFARKNYFYPDLPKGYQVSQDTAPICTGGYLDIESKDGPHQVVLNRIHMEEDAGKSIHDLEDGYSCIDLNRAGTPLLEIVTEPCLHSAEQAFAFLTSLRKLLRWLNVCDGNMEEGSMRCDANISVRPVGQKELGTRVEVKNLNSIRNVKRAIEIESERLIDLLERGEKVVQQTRSFDADKQTTFALRSKEEANDYRYFPEPDLPAFFLSDEQVAQVKAAMPILPEQLEEKYQQAYNLSAYDAALICSDKDDAAFYEQLVADNSFYKAAANWMNGPLRAICNEKQISLQQLPVSAAQLSKLISFTESGKVSFNVASTRLLPVMMEQPDAAPMELAQALNLLQESDEGQVQQWIDEVINSMPDKVKEFKAGKKNLLGLFAGQVKKISGGKADMQLVQKILTQQLNK